MIEVELDDGTILEIDAQDQATAVQAARRYMQTRGKPQQPAMAEPAPFQPLEQRPMVPRDKLVPEADNYYLEPPQTPTPGPFDSALKGLQRGAQITGRAAANVAGAPVDIATLALNAPAMIAGQEPPIRAPFGGSEMNKRMGGAAADALGIPTEDLSQLQGPERVIAKAQEMATEGLFGGALFRGAGAALPASRTAQTLAAPYTEAIQMQQGARPVIGDLAAGTGSGIAVSGVEQMNNPLADLFASLVGGVGGATAARVATAPAKTAQSVIDFNRTDPNTGATVRQSNIARRMAQDLAVDPQRAAQNIADETSYMRNAGVPETATPTTGLMSNDPGLIAAERADTTRRVNPRLGVTEANAPADFAQRYRNVSGEASRAVQELSPGDNVNSRAAQQFVEADATQQRQAVQEPLTRAQQEAEALRQQNTTQITDAQARREQALVGADRRVSRLGQRVEQAATEEGDLGGQIAGRRGSEGAASEVLAKQLADRKAADEAKKAGLYREASDLGRSTEVDPTPLADTAKAVRDDIGRLDQPDARLSNILGDLEKLAVKQGEPREAAGFVPQAPEAPPVPTKVSVKEMIDALPRISRARDASSRDMLGHITERLDTLGQSVRAELNKLADAGDPAAIKWREAEGNFREDFAPKYREGVGRELDQAERRGTPVPPTATAEKFVKPGAGGKEAASDLKRILGEDGEKAARDYVLADMAKVVGADGRVNPARLKTWIADRAGMFEVMPTLKAEAEGVLRDVVNKREARTALQRELESASLERKNLGVTTQKQIADIKANAKLTEAEKAEQIKALEAKVKDTERSIREAPTALLLGANPKVAAAEVFKSRDPQTTMRGIVKKLKSDPEALAGWKKALSEHFDETLLKTNKSATDDNLRSPSFAELDNLFQKHEKVLREVYDAGEMNSLRRAHRLVQNLERRNVRSTVGSTTAEYTINEQDLRPVEIMTKLYFGQLKGGGIMRSVKIALPNLPGYNDAEKAGVIIRRMWTDPELAKHLLTTPAPGPSAARWNKKLNLLMGAQEAGAESADTE